MTGERKWYWVELNASTSKGFTQFQAFKEFLHGTVDKFEVSGCFECVHFEIYATDYEVEVIDEWLDENVYFDAITERSA